MIATHVPAGGRGGGGMVRYAVELAAALHRRPDVDLSVVAAADARAFFVDLLGDPARVITLPALPTAARSVLERLTRRCEAAGPVDVLQGTKQLLPRRSSALRLLTVHDMMLFERPRDFGPLKRTTLRQPYRASIRDADVIACVSEATRQALRRWVPGYPARDGVVPLALSSSLRAAAAEPVASLHGRRFALMVGDASPRKNLSLVVGAWDEVVRAVPGAVLAIAGPPGWNTNEYGADFERLRQQCHIVHLGHVSDGQLRWCYENARVTLCPSLLEGFGLPAVEALAFDSPLITSLDPALCEVTGDRATHLPATDAVAHRGAWTGAVARAMTGERRAVPSGYVPRSWDDVAGDTVALVRGPARAD